MNAVERALRQAWGDLVAEGASAALVGGLAVSVRAEPRLTRDADFAVAVDSDEAAEDLVSQLVGRGYRVVAVTERTETGRLATARLARGAPTGAVTDLLFASSGIEHEIADSATDEEILPGLVLAVATIGHLMALKLLARDDRLRPVDADDLRSLAALADDADWAEARSAVELITRRGYARGRDLLGSLAALRADGAY